MLWGIRMYQVAKTNIKLVVGPNGNITMPENNYKLKDKLK